MFFSVLPAGARARESQPERAYLVRDDWDDWFKFATSFDLIVFDGDGTRHEVGWLKIGQFGMGDGDVRSPELPAQFNALDEQFFSLGQSENYYETINSLGPALRNRILIGLRDIAADLSILESVRDEPVLTVSLMRSVAEHTINGRFNRLTQGNAELTRYHFEYIFPTAGRHLWSSFDSCEACVRGHSQFATAYKCARSHWAKWRWEDALS